MKTKIEAIAKAYGTYWKNYESFTDENGWNWHYSSDEIDPDIFEYKGSGGNFRSRPKSLAGIENNNGWIKIESEADLPSEGWHWTLSIIENEPFQTHYEDINARYHTHYQPIIKPEPPIY